MPVSSASSRRAAAARSSSGRTNPPGSAHQPAYGSSPRRTASAHNWSSRTVRTTRSTVTATGGKVRGSYFLVTLTRTLRLLYRHFDDTRGGPDGRRPPPVLPPAPARNAHAPHPP